MGSGRPNSNNHHNRNHHSDYYSCAEVVSFLAISATCLIVIVTVLLTAYYLVVFQNPPIEFINIPFPTDQKVYQRGDPLVIDAQYCRYTNSPFQLAMEFENSIVVQVPSQFRAGDAPGCQNRKLTVMDIPHNLPPGEWRLRAKDIYQVGPFRAERIVSWVTEEFEVIE